MKRKATMLCCLLSLFLCGCKEPVSSVSTSVEESEEEPKTELLARLYPRRLSFECQSYPYEVNIDITDDDREETYLAEREKLKQDPDKLGTYLGMVTAKEDNLGEISDRQCRIFGNGDRTSLFVEWNDNEYFVANLTHNPNKYSPKKLMEDIYFLSDEDYDEDRKENHFLLSGSYWDDNLNQSFDLSKEEVDTIFFSLLDGKEDGEAAAKEMDAMKEELMAPYIGSGMIPSFGSLILQNCIYFYLTTKNGSTFEIIYEINTVNNAHKYVRFLNETIRMDSAFDDFVEGKG